MAWAIVFAATAYMPCKTERAQRSQNNIMILAIFMLIIASIRALVL